jgi:predicted DNA-binding transcriptional regulator AlpA
MDDFISASDLAKKLGTTRKHIYNMTLAGLLPHVRISKGQGAIRYSTRMIEAWIADRMANSVREEEK